jgi:two-component system response regulator GlrR
MNYSIEEKNRSTQKICGTAVGLGHRESLLVIDDDPDFQVLLKSSLEYEGYNVTLADSVETMNQRVGEQKFSAALLDYRLGKEDGLKAMQSLIKYSPATRIVMLTGHGSIELAVDAMHKGASYFLTKNAGPKKIAQVLQKVLGYQTGKDFGDKLTDCSGFNSLNLIGRSPEFMRVLSQIERVKDVDSTVLISGESGTGKELIAKAIHFNSKNSAKVFRAINCAAIPENLIESELFGHRRGAFTDAKMDRKGLFEECSDGTLLLDEIGEIPLHVQAKLLRVLQEKEICPVGASKTQSVNTRVLAATNRDLKEEVKAGRFREDLYFRLSVLQINVPALRDRVEDIPVLVENFVKHFNEKFNKNVAQPSLELMSRLISNKWSGNVRELRNAIERGIVLSSDGELHMEDLFPRANEEALAMKKLPVACDVELAEEMHRPLADVRRRLEEASLRRVLTATRGNISKAARILGIYRANIYRMTERYNINLKEFKN